MKYNWSSGEAYEQYVGRWSRLVAAEFLAWLEMAPGLDWLDVGCGTGALAQTILQTAAPRAVKGCDFSEAYVATARMSVLDPRVRFEHADAMALPDADHTFDVAVSGIAINFVSDPQRALSEMRRVVRPGGVIAVYVWDYAELMQLMRVFWDAAVALDANAAELDEARRFPLCRPEPLRTLFESAELGHVSLRAIDIPTRFSSFETFWAPFEGAQGPAPGYLASLDVERQEQLRAAVQSRLPIASDGSISLIARAWAAKGATL